MVNGASHRGWRRGSAARSTRGPASATARGGHTSPRRAACRRRAHTVLTTPAASAVLSSGRTPQFALGLKPVLPVVTVFAATRLIQFVRAARDIVIWNNRRSTMSCIGGAVRLLIVCSAAAGCSHSDSPSDNHCSVALLPAHALLGSSRKKKRIARLMFANLSWASRLCRRAPSWVGSRERPRGCPARRLTARRSRRRATTGSRLSSGTAAMTAAWRTSARRLRTPRGQRSAIRGHTPMLPTRCRLTFAA